MKNFVLKIFLKFFPSLIQSDLTGFVPYILAIVDGISKRFCIASVEVRPVCRMESRKGGC